MSVRNVPTADVDHGRSDPWTEEAYDRLNESERGYIDRLDAMCDLAKRSHASGPVLCLDCGKPTPHPNAPRCAECRLRRLRDNVERARQRLAEKRAARGTP